MNFTVKTQDVVHKGRTGVLAEFCSVPEMEYETPTFMLYAKGGVISHLTYETMQLISSDSYILEIPLPSIATMKDVIPKSNQKFLSNFIGMKEYPSYVCLHDPLNINLQPNKKKKEVTLKGRRGNMDFTAEKFISCIESIVPDMYQVMTQLEFTDKTKRTQINVDRSMRFLDDCLSLHQKSKVLKSTSIIAAIQGGSDLSLRRQCAELCATRDVHGFLIDGLSPSREATEDLPSEQVNAILENIVPHLPASKVRLIQGTWSPMNIVHFVQHGIDLFDSSLPLTLAERGCAFTFQYTKSIPMKPEVSKTNGSLHNTDSIKVESDTPSKDQADVSMDADEDNIKDTLYNPRPYEMCLRHPRFITDLTPILAECECFTCQHHTRAYINHLINVNEMLAPVLLSIHNLHHYNQFFRTIRAGLLSQDLSSYAFHFKDADV